MTPGSPVASNRSIYSPVPDNSAVLRPGTLENEYDIVPEATNSAWPRSSTAAVPSMGNTTSSPAASRESADVPGPAGNAQNERHVPEKPLRPTRGVHDRHRDGLVLPEHGVMLEEHRVGGVERQLGDRDHVAVDLYRARPEVDLGQVPEAGGLAPPGVAHPVALVQRRSTAVTASSVGEVMGVAPLALDPLSDVSHSHKLPQGVLRR